MSRRRGMAALWVALLAGAMAAAATAAPGKAVHTIGGEITDSADGSVFFDVKVKNGKPKLVKEIVINDVPVNCSISGDSTASPDLSGLKAKVKQGKFRLEENTGQNLVFKGKFTSSKRAEGTIDWAFSEAGNDCATDGAREWKARPPSR